MTFRLFIPVLAAMPAVATATDEPLLPEVKMETVVVDIDSGVIHGSIAARTSITAQPELAWSTVVDAGDAPWIRLAFDEILLAEQTDDTRGSYLLVTSLDDNNSQIIDAAAARVWSDTTAYFNGGALRLELFVAPSSDPDANRIDIASATIGDPISSRSICGSTDDRLPSTDPRAGRLWPIGCTGWLIKDRTNTLLTAGHCSPGGGDVMQFNVPLSSSSGSPRMPSPQDQYPVDGTSAVLDSGGIGQDWGVFGCFDNTDTGLSPYEAQGLDGYVLAAAPPAVDGRPIRVTGYGTTGSGVPREWNLAQKTHTGPFNSRSGNTIRYRPDTTGGNSGSAVVDDTTGWAIGIHTHAGCNSTGGANQGTSIDHPSIFSNINNPIGVRVQGPTFDYVGGRPDIVKTNGSSALRVEVGPRGSAIPSGDVTLHVNGDSGETTIVMTEVEPGVFAANFPGGDCGNSATYYLSAQDTRGITWFDPPVGRIFPNEVGYGDGENIALQDDFETDSGWAVSDSAITTGTWERTVPTATGTYAPNGDFDGSGTCWVTDNRTNSDVDGGPTRLTSPAFDLSGISGDPVLSFARWFAASSSSPALFSVELSDDDGATWVSVPAGTATSAWVVNEYRLLDHISLTSAVRLRVSVTDNPNSFIVEGAIDALKISEVVCSDCVGDFNGDNLIDFFDASAFITALNNGDPSADLNSDGFLDFFDVSAFLQAFAAGCP